MSPFNLNDYEREMIAAEIAKTRRQMIRLGLANSPMLVTPRPEPERPTGRFQNLDWETL